MLDYADPNAFQTLDEWVEATIVGATADRDHVDAGDVLRISDITLEGGFPVSYQAPERRVDGVAQPKWVGEKVVDPALIMRFTDGFPQNILNQYNETSDASGRITIANEYLPVRHVRIQLWRSGLGPILTLRLQPRTAKTYEELDGPPELMQLVRTRRRGTILVGGEKRSGKTWLMHGIVETLNQTDPEPRNVLVIGDPPEFDHERKYSAIRTREIGQDTPSYASALRGSLRQNTDMLLASELRGDVETSRAFLQMSQVATLSMAAVHMASTAHVLQRILTPFPDGERADVIQTLTNSLIAVVVLRLVPGVDGKDILASEMLTVTEKTASMIAKPAQLAGHMQGKRENPEMRSWLLEDDLARLVRAERITPATARAYCNDPTRLRI